MLNKLNGIESGRSDNGRPESGRVVKIVLSENDWKYFWYFRFFRFFNSKKYRKINLSPKIPENRFKIIDNTNHT